MKNLKELSIRIKNIQSVQKTTKIMQMISATKLSQNQKKLLYLRMYISKLHNIISFLSKAKTLNVKNDDLYLLFIIASDRGLCGNFNSSIIKFSHQHIENFILNSKSIDIVFLGTKAFDIGKNKLDSSINILHTEKSKDITLERINSIINGMDLSKYSKIKIFYNKFYNTFVYKSTLEIVKPWNSDSSLIDKSLINVMDYLYAYEPNDTEFILKSLVQNYTAIAIYSALLENATSENSARMVTMESANRNTKEMLGKLSLSYNRSRQAAITTDLIEIISGAEFS
ncbi:F0F1 ATP synthase subunit gamma [Wolbachia pipientis]|uniref:ATP synthase gamma chain n=1 Tax=Wolbachia pipientis TaxID=955 RepID=A0A1E7QKC7_WOLPI|nr:ATP synthase F1 subunit gamma [Wolbachia pipientis]OEY86847.1 F0F1 ATP synthase subunit gamma [Wolbachia pipientis]